MYIAVQKYLIERILQFTTNAEFSIETPKFLFLLMNAELRDGERMMRIKWKENSDSLKRGIRIESNLMV